MEVTQQVEIAAKSPGRKLSEREKAVGYIRTVSLVQLQAQYSVQLDEDLRRLWWSDVYVCVGL